MNPRERVIAALNHRQPDRVPIDLGGTIVTSITRSSYLALKQHLGEPVEAVVNALLLNGSVSGALASRLIRATHPGELLEE